MDQTRGVILLLLIACVGLTGYAGLWMRSAEEKASRAAEERADVYELASQAIALRQAPVVAAGSGSDQDFLSVINEAATAAGIADDEILSIKSQAPNRRPKLKRVEYVSTVEVRDVSLAMLTRLLQELDKQRELPIAVASINLREPVRPTDASSDEVWDIQLTLMASVFEP